MKIDLEAIQAKIDNQKQIQSALPSSATTGSYEPEDRKLVNWFFASLRTQYGAAKFNSQFGEGEDVTFAKRHWAPRILKHTPEQLKEMLAMADNERLAGNDKFMWPDPAAILSLVANSWERRAHKVFESPPMLENKTAKERALEERKAQLSQLREQVGL